MNNQKFLYEILYPNPALVASQYNPEEFAKYYSHGTTRYYDGKIIFAEIDINFRNDYFDIDRALKDLKPHPDGRLKATKFISTYRVLENMNLDSIKRLYLTTPEGISLGLDSKEYDNTKRPQMPRIYAQVCPLKMLVLTDYNFYDFGKNITDPDNRKGAPKLFYAQLDLALDDFLEDFEENPLMHPPIPGLHPSKLRDAIMDIRNRESKHTKGLSLDSSFNKISYKKIKHGFMFSSQEKSKFFPMPKAKELEVSNYKFWKSM